MFISQINKSYTFGPKTWLVSIAYQAGEKQRKIPGISLFIEGVRHNGILFTHYDINALPWQPGQNNNSDYIGYLSKIVCLEKRIYNESNQHAPLYTFEASPILCDRLSKYLNHMAYVLENNLMVINNTPPKSALIRKNASQWCIDLLNTLCEHC